MKTRAMELCQGLASGRPSIDSSRSSPAPVTAQAGPDSLRLRPCVEGAEECLLRVGFAADHDLGVLAVEAGSAAAMDPSSQCLGCQTSTRAPASDSHQCHDLWSPRGCLPGAFSSANWTAARPQNSASGKPRHWPCWRRVSLPKYSHRTAHRRLRRPDRLSMTGEA